MPASRRYTVPKGTDWSGGIVGGVLVNESGSKPWVVRFTDGSKVEKRRTFSNKDSALAWRRKYSNRSGRTNNAWRFRRGDRSVVEMTLSRGRTVIYDAEFLDKFSKFVWTVDKFDRVYTTRRVITSRYGINSDAKREVRSGPAEVFGQASMCWMMDNDDLKNPRRIVGTSAEGIIDNRRANIVTITESRNQRAEAAAKPKTEVKAKPKKARRRRKHKHKHKSK